MTDQPSGGAPTDLFPPARPARSRTATWLNPLTLMAAIAFVAFFPAEKEIWYDEVVTILISKGISHDTPRAFSEADSVPASAIHRLNDLPNVYAATVGDNGNSVLYNVALHWFSARLGNSLGAYTAFSKLGSIATLVALYALANLMLPNTWFTALAVALLTADINFVGMSHEIRAYSMGMLFVTLAALYCLRFARGAARPVDLFLAASFSAAAFLTHYLTVYLILGLVAYLAIATRRRLVSWRNAAAILLPAAIVAVHLYVSLTGLELMGEQNAAWRRERAPAFSLAVVALQSLTLAELDFKIVPAAFVGSPVAAVLCAVLVAALYAASVRLARTRADRGNLHVLFLLGASGTAFLALLSVAAHHHTPLYARYHSFGAPFATLFTAYATYVLANSERLGRWLRLGVVGVVSVPTFALLASVVRGYRPQQLYNHAAVARQIRAERIRKVGVPEWRHALLVNSFLPSDFQTEYVRTGGAPQFTLHGPGSERAVPLVSGH